MTRSTRFDGRARAALGACALLAGAAACASGATPPGPQAPPDSLLAPARIAALPAARRDAWSAYLEASRRSRERDRAVMDEELASIGAERWTPAPAGPGFALTDEMTEAWFATGEARRLADHLVSYQTPSGGWSKRVDFALHPRQAGESFASEKRWSWIGTLDNGATTEQLRFLAAAVRAHGDPRHAASFLKGLDYLLAAQFPNGCWPQVYPLQGGYHDAVTFNDDATVRAIQILDAAARGEPGFVPAEARRRAGAAVERGVACLLASQVVLDGRRTVWGAQHDPLTLRPVRARAYEHASLSGRESAALVNFLMSLEAPGPAVVEAVHAAAAWFRSTAIHGYRYETKGELAASPGAGPIWARFYEIGTDRPIFSDRDGVIRYSLAEIGEERRRGYGWYTDEPRTTLRRYERWKRRHPAAGAPAPR